MIEGDRAKLISMDVANDVAPKDSKLEYTHEEVLFWQKVKREFEAVRAKNPNAYMHTPE